MKKMNVLLAKIAQLSAAAALVVGMSSVNSACAGWIHQPEVPAKMTGMRKIK